jgi:FkbM family methyltransferase
MKKLIKNFLHKLGLEISKSGKIGSINRPVGNLKTFLEDVKKRKFNPKLILDVGANNAGWSETVKDIFPNAKIVLAEPLAEFKPAIEKYLEKNPSDLAVFKAIGSKTEIKEITVTTNYLDASTFLYEKLDASSNYEKREIDVITIDQLLKEHHLAAPDIIKLDIQGYEMEALKGANSTFGKTEMYIIEVSLFPFIKEDRELIDDIIIFMKEKGYSIYDFAGFLRRNYDGALSQCDICFVKKDSFLRQSNIW